MKSTVYITALVLLIAVVAAVIGTRDNSDNSYAQFHDPIYAKLKEDGCIKGAKQMPNNWFTMQRAYPGASIPKDKYVLALNEAKAIRSQKGDGMFRDAVWQFAGPTNIPGRMTDIAIDPTGKSKIYAASAAGGIYKSTDAGINWTQTFDDEGTQSMGAIAIDPTTPTILYAGTGEANASGDSYEGTGIYKSTDGGDTWSLSGLENSYHIGRIVVTSSHTVYVAAMGKLFGTNPDRGVYRSTDYGASWEHLLFIDDTTGCIDIARSETTGYLYAAMWHRWRLTTDRRVGGYTSGVYRSTDDGATWNQLVFGLPANSADNGRIGLAVSDETVYAIYADHPGYFMGVYKSTNSGASFSQVNDWALNDVYSSYGWYFGNIRVSPTDPDMVFVLGLYQMRSTDGGDSWEQVDMNIHVDHHALEITDPSHPGPAFTYNGCDGGMNLSTNYGTTWDHRYGMGNTQFYAIGIDFLNPERLYGGTQDNGSMRTPDGGLDNWDHILGGDGFYCVIDYTDSDIIYAEYQWGSLYKSTNFGGWWSYALNGMDYMSDRHNWCTPVVMDKNDPSVLYYGAQKLYKTTNGGDYWSAISDDLTDGPGPGNLTYGTITTIDVSATDPDVIMVGTDDANVWITQNGGDSWVPISIMLPDRWVTRVVIDPADETTAYVTFSGYKESDHLPHIYRTTNSGGSWTAIDGNLPDAPINDVVVDPLLDQTLYIATDFGPFYTTDMGTTWQALGTGIPLSPIHDFAFHAPTRKLVAGTHGRSMWTLILECTGPDSDEDGIADICDNCPDEYNPEQEDNDMDNIGNACDNCPDVINPDQLDGDSDDAGDLCDNCLDLYNPGQEDYDSDYVGNLCDNCPTTPNGDQADGDDDEIGDLCDNCPADHNPAQGDSDGDLVGDICDNCPDDQNYSQDDTDSDSVGNACDNCPDVYNPDQADEDSDGIGDVCDNICGDANASGDVDIDDAVYLIAYIFSGGPAPSPLESGDADCSGDIDIDDVVKLIAYIFTGGYAPCDIDGDGQLDC